MSESVYTIIGDGQVTIGLTETAEETDRALQPYIEQSHRYLDETDE